MIILFSINALTHHCLRVAEFSYYTLVLFKNFVGLKKSEPSTKKIGAKEISYLLEVHVLLHVIIKSGLFTA